MDHQTLISPLAFLQPLLHAETHTSDVTALKEYEEWWNAEGISISDAVDRAGTPWLRMFDEYGSRVDEILLPPDYWKMLKKGYQAGAIWRPFEEESLKSHYLLDYVTCFFDAGLGCPYIVSLSTAVPLKKYGGTALQALFLPHLLLRDRDVWQGATWITEAKGGSDIGANVETSARNAGEHWILNGEKFFASNVGAELAIVAARPEGAPRTAKGLALFLVPRYRKDGELNYLIRHHTLMVIICFGWLLISRNIGPRTWPCGSRSGAWKSTVAWAYSLNIALSVGCVMQ